MNPTLNLVSHATVARERLDAQDGGPFLTADWERALFLHFAVSPEVLQPETPFPLDTRGGKAYVSLVAFSMRNTRLAQAPWVPAPVVGAVAAHPFLNVRTYVTVNGEPGIVFLREWMTNAVGRILGPMLYGLPYQLARLNYRNHHEFCLLDGHVAAEGKSLHYTGGLHNYLPYTPAVAGGEAEFLLERYTAYTSRAGVARRFRVWHEPWQFAPAEVRLTEDSLLRATESWFPEAEFVGAHYSPGVFGVLMGRPEVLGRNSPSARHP